MNRVTFKKIFVKSFVLDLLNTEFIKFRYGILWDISGGTTGATGAIAPPGDNLGGA